MAGEDSGIEETATTAVLCRQIVRHQVVLSTLHSPVAAGAVMSMAALGVNRYYLSNCLMGVVAQRLVRTLCPKCRVAYDISESPETFAYVQLLPRTGIWTYIFGPSAVTKEPAGIPRRRTAIVELLVFQSGNSATRRQGLHQ